MNEFLWDPSSEKDLPKSPEHTKFQNPDADLQADEVVEIPILLAGWQVWALEHEAHQRGLTAGEMVRHVLRDFIDGASVPTKGQRRAEAV
jgi:hypothetical protein